MRALGGICFVVPSFGRVTSSGDGDRVASLPPPTVVKPSVGFAPGAGGLAQVARGPERCALCDVLK